MSQFLADLSIEQHAYLRELLDALDTIHILKLTCVHRTTEYLALVTACTCIAGEIAELRYDIAKQAAPWFETLNTSRRVLIV